MVRDHGDLRKALIAAVHGLDGAVGLQRRYLKARAALPDRDPETLLDRILPHGDGSGQDTPVLKGMKLTTILDDDYPNMLRHIADPPLVLFFAGEVQTLHRPCIAIVGSRSCTTYGQQVTKKIAGELAGLGFVIVSGLALGIDAHAHAASLAVGGRTVGVLGSGIDQIYPRGHRDLARDMVTGGGAIVSEFPPGTPPRAFHFPIRNRLISGLCHATIVVEAKAQSGSLITARHCLDQGRELFAVPGPINHATAEGTHRLIRGGEAQLLVSVESVLEQLKPLLGLAASQEREVAAAIEDPLAKKIYERLDAFEAMPLDLLVAEMGLETGVVVAKLVELETLNLVERKPGLFYLRNPLLSTN